jgi:hypothetical protein
VIAQQVFAGREQELEYLAQLLARSHDGQGQVCLVFGEAGRGKTALCAEFARRAQETHEDLLVAVGNGGESNQLYRNDGGSFTEVAGALGSALSNTLTLDGGDGDLDLAFGNEGRQGESGLPNDSFSVGLAALYWPRMHIRTG